LAIPDRGDLIEHATAAAGVIKRLRTEATRAGLPVVYVNDNYGQWHSDRDKIIDHCQRRGSLGRAIVERIRPREKDYFIIKPQFSGFYATNLQVLLPQLGVRRLILTGIAADICVLFTAADAHMRDYALWVPRDAVASSRDEHRDWALGIMEKSMDAATVASPDMSVKAWADQ
jgi:nicotinamidase-related amidase